MKLRTIKTESEYQKTLERFEEVFNAEPGTNDSDEADVLSLLIKDYEDHNIVIDSPNPIENDLSKY